MCCASSITATENSRSMYASSKSRCRSAYEVMTMSAFAISPNSSSRPGPETTSVFRRGVNFFASASQFLTREVGATMSAGWRTRASVRGRASQASVWSVLPSPISSARSPLRSFVSRWRIQYTPVFWYGRRILPSSPRETVSYLPPSSPPRRVAFSVQRAASDESTSITSPSEARDEATYAAWTAPTRNHPGAAPFCDDAQSRKTSCIVSIATLSRRTGPESLKRHPSPLFSAAWISAAGISAPPASNA